MISGSWYADDITLLISENPQTGGRDSDVSRDEQALFARDQQVLKDDQQEAKGEREQEKGVEDQHDETASDRRSRSTTEKVCVDQQYIQNFTAGASRGSETGAVGKIAQKTKH